MVKKWHNLTDEELEFAMTGGIPLTEDEKIAVQIAEETRAEMYEEELRLKEKMKSAHDTTT